MSNFLLPLDNGVSPAMTITVLAECARIPPAIACARVRFSAHTYALNCRAFVKRHGRRAFQAAKARIRRIAVSGHIVP